MSAVETAFRGLDEAAIEAWASPGLLSIGARDLERAPVEVIERSEARWRVRVGEAVVELVPGGLTETWCSCPAWSPCRHAVAAVLSLFVRAGEAPVEVDPLDGVDLEAVRAWAGPTAYVDAWRLRLAGVEVETERAGAQWVARIPDLDAEVRLLGSAGLSGLLVQAAPRAKKRLGALGLIAGLQARLGAEIQPPPEVGQVDLSGVKGAARAPEQIIEAAQDILQQMIVVGLCHVSEATAERLFTASVSAQAARLVRLGKGLAGLTDEVRWQLSRHASADEARLFARMSALHALAAALAAAGDQAPEGLVGRPRARYTDVPRLHLAGLGARRLVTDSGSVGLVTVFRDLANPRWLTMADVRPAEQMMGFDPGRRFFARDVWGEHSFATLARTELRVQTAKVSDDGRLSASSQTQAELVRTTPCAVIDGLVQDDFRAVRAQAHEAFPLGLRPPPPHARLAVLAPHQFSDPTFDPRTQTLAWPLRDADGHTVEVRVRHGEHTGDLIRNIEAWRPAGPAPRVLVELASAGAVPTAHLVSILTPGPEGLAVYCPSLEDPRGPRRPAARDHHAPAPASHPALSAARAWLEMWAERGLTATPTQLDPPSPAAAKAGFQTLAAALDRVADTPAPQALLAARYVLTLSERAASRMG